MEILKQHYEKIVLGALLLGFVFALIYLLQMIGSANTVTLNDLKFAAPSTKYESTDFKGHDFSTDYLFGERVQWAVRSGGEKLGFTAELAVPMKAIRCSACRKIVPLALVKEKLECPICHKKLENPPDVSEALAADQRGMDSDGDGMPDTYEVKMGFNPEDARDASQDKDGDGFSNLYEFLMGTDPTNSKSFPSLEKRIYLVRLRKALLPIRLEGVTPIPDPADKNSKKFWDISLTLNRQRTSVALGQTIELAKRQYKVADAEYKVRDLQDSSVVLNEDDSKVTLEPVDGQGEKIILQTGKKVYAPNHRAEIEDIATGKTFRVGVGDTFRVGDEKSGQVSFQVVSTDAAKEHVTLLNQETGSEVLMTRDIKIPPEARVGYSDENRFNPDRGGGMPGDDFAPAPAPRRRRSRN